MAQARWIFEGAALVIVAAIVAGCESQWQHAARNAPMPPDGLDYLMAVQCGGLSSAEATLDGDYAGSRADKRAGRFEGWAQIRAREAGQDPALARQDMAASEKLFLEETGQGPSIGRLHKLWDLHRGDLAACHSLSEVEDVVIVGG